MTLVTWSLLLETWFRKANGLLNLSYGSVSSDIEKRFRWVLTFRRNLLLPSPG